MTDEVKTHYEGRCMEKNLEDELASKELHDLHEMPLMTSSEDLSEEDAQDFVEEVFYQLGKVLDRPLPKQLKSDLIYLRELAERTIKWSRTN